METIKLPTEQLTDWRQMEPVDAYLGHDLDTIREDIESFGRLADAILERHTAGDYGPTPPCSPSGSSAGQSAGSWSSASCSSPSSCSCARSPGRRRKRNASAAGRYRRSLKGRERELAEEAAHEERRNGELRRRLAAKLDLYREFAQLLAANTLASDFRLAAEGSRSLAAVFAEVLAGGPEVALADELGALLQRFRAIASPRRAATC